MIIKIQNLSKEYSVKDKQGFWKDAFMPKYKKVLAVDQISFEIDKGESVALLGPNGAGKTTTMKMLSGLLYPSSGNIEVLGYFPFDRKKEFLRKIGLVMGNKTGLNWDLTPNQNFQLTKQIYQIEVGLFQKRLKDFSQLLDLYDLMNTQVRKLSLGERMKAELIGSLLHNPEVLFLDEPTIGLDILSKQKIRKFLREIQKNSDVTLLLTSHDMDDVEQVSDRVIVVNHGSIVFNNSMSELLRNYKGKKYLTLILTEEIEYKEIRRYGKIVDKKPLSYTIEIPVENQSKIIAEITEKLPIDDIDVVHVPLEEIITDLFTSKIK